MLVEFFCGGSLRRAAGAWAGLVMFVAHGLFNAWLKLRLNTWYAKFYDLMQDSSSSAPLLGELSGEDVSVNEEAHLAARRDEVAALLWKFCYIVAPAVVVHPVAKFFSSRWTYAWRVCLLRAYLEVWNPTGQAIEGAAQRLHEDTQRFADGVYSCVTMLLDSALTLSIFSPLLYDLGTQIAAPVSGSPDAWLLLTAVGGAVGGFGISALVGRHLVTLEVKNQSVEAKLRTRLVLFAEHPEDAPTEPLSLALESYLSELWNNYARLFRHFVLMNTWLSIFDQTWVIVPYVLCAPRLFAADPARRITLGTLVQASNAFGKVFDSLAVVSHNWAAVNAFRSVVRRLREFERCAYGVRGKRTTLVESMQTRIEVAVELVEMDEEVRYV